MASVASSSGVSPISGFETDENSEAFAYIEAPNSTSPNTGSVFFHSPGGSTGSYVVVGHNGQFMGRSSPAALSPFLLDSGNDAAASMLVGTIGEAGGPSNFMAASMDASQELFNMDNLEEGFDSMGTGWAPQEYFTGDNLQGLSPFLDNPQPNTFQFPELEIPQSMQANSNAVPWSPMDPHPQGLFNVEDYTSPQPTSASVSPVPRSAEAASPEMKQELSSVKASIPSPIRRVRGAGARVEKKRDASSSASSSLGGSPTSKFVIVTPNTISAHAGKANPYECLEAMRPSQRGRKGPLANDTKENALQVRRRGACFHCHARKVKCDKERPCKNCRKLITDVPQVVCWQFPDFLPILFPDFIRGHFENNVLLRFKEESVAEFKLYGVERTCEVELSSGWRFRNTLKIHAKFFTAKGSEINKHWHMTAQADSVSLQIQDSAPIGLETSTNSPKDELRKALREPVKEYIEALLREPAFAYQVTETLEPTTWIPTQVMQIIHQYFQHSDQPLLKRALSICAMHYVMTRQLTLTNLQCAQDVPQNSSWRTTRMLNRQVKAIVDELIQKEMTKVFEDFSRSLKSKSRKEWAPCLAAFLVTCFFMESIEYAADVFVASEIDICNRQRRPPTFPRKKALEINQEIENMPFKQFAFQFHQVFLTHTKDASAKSFNPLLDNSLLESDDLDPAAAAMARSFKALLDDDNARPHLEELAQDPILPNTDTHPYPRNTAGDYIGRLVAKFLLSFRDEKYIFEPKA